MFKKKDISILIMVLAAVLIFTGTEAMAVVVPPMKCTFVNINGSNTAVTMSVITDQSGNFPIATTDPTTGKAVYVWAYQISGATPNQLNALEDVCPTPMDYKLASGGQVQAPGAGDQTTGFGVGDYQDQIVRMAAQQSSNAYGLPAGSYSFTTSRAGDTKNTSMAIKISNSTYYCPNIAGPACYQPKIAQTTVQKIQLNPDMPDAFITVTFRSDGSIVSVTDNTGAPLVWHDISEFPPINGQPLTYMPDGAIMKTGDNSYWTYWNGNRYVTVYY